MNMLYETLFAIGFIGLIVSFLLDGRTDRFVPPRAAHGKEHSGFVAVFASPLNLFGVVLMIGGLGLAARPFLSGAALPIAAFLGGAILGVVVVRPLHRIIARSATQREHLMDEMISESAEALSNFESGRGLVRVKVDGEYVQLTARLTESDQNAEVVEGDWLLITTIDAAHGSCVVTTDLSTRNPF